MEKPAPLPDPPLGAPWEFALIVAAGSLLAGFCVWLGIGLQDGLLSAWLQIVGKKLLKQQLWLLPASMVAGVLLHTYYTGILRPGVKPMDMPGTILLAIPRAFAHFPLYGFVALMSVLIGFFLLAARWVRDLALRRPAAPAAEGFQVEAWLATPLWFTLFPLIALDVENHGDMTLPVTVSRARLLRWLLAACAMLMFWTQMISDQTDERVDPFWLTAFGAFWLGDYLLVALRVCPIVRARRGLPP